MNWPNRSGVSAKQPISLQIIAAIMCLGALSLLWRPLAPILHHAWDVFSVNWVLNAGFDLVMAAAFVASGLGVLFHNRESRSVVLLIAWANIGVIGIVFFAALLNRDYSYQAYSVTLGRNWMSVAIYGVWHTWVYGLLLILWCWVMLVLTIGKTRRLFISGR